MSMIEVELLARDGNVAVVQMPGRKFPGIFVQGDTMATLRDLFVGLDVTMMPEEVIEARDRINELMEYYEAALSRRGVRPPY